VDCFGSRFSSSKKKKPHRDKEGATRGERCYEERSGHPVFEKTGGRAKHKKCFLRGKSKKGPESTICRAQIVARFLEGGDWSEKSDNSQGGEGEANKATARLQGFSNSWVQFKASAVERLQRRDGGTGKLNRDYRWTFPPYPGQQAKL